jgi:hypothetical protein
MEVPVDLYNRLSDEDMRILPPDLELPDHSDRVTLPKNESMQMESGLITAHYLLKMAQVMRIHMSIINRMDSSMEQESIFNAYFSR